GGGGFRSASVSKVGASFGLNGAMIVRHPKIKRLRYKAGLYDGHGEVDPTAIAEALKKPGDAVIVDDPRGVAVPLGRKLAKLSTKPVTLGPLPPQTSAPTLPSEEDLIKLLQNAEDWSQVANTSAERAASGARIRARARAAEMLLARKAASAVA